MQREVVGFRFEIFIAHPEGDIDENDEGWHFDEWADDADKGLSGVRTEDSHSYRCITTGLG
jgi:hypothetical protein